MKPKPNFSIRLDASQRAALEKIAAKLDRPVGYLIRQAIDNYIKEQTR
jgi:predicted transcriptional regulator